MKLKLLTMLGVSLLSASQFSQASCDKTIVSSLPTAAGNAAAQPTGGYGLKMWVTYVDETGKVCSVITTGQSGASAGNSAWLGSRVISAQKANTANSFSTDGYTISTANLYSAVQPGGSLFGLQFSNPVETEFAYPITQQNPQYGTSRDVMIGKRVGGINVFGGGLALYRNGVKVGAIGVSGDTSCRDHGFAWNVRKELGLQPVAPATVGITTNNMDAYGTVKTKLVGATVGDEMIIDPDHSRDYWSAWSQPACPNSLGLTDLQNANNGTLILPVRR